MTMTGGDYIRRLRKDRGLSQTDLGRLVGVSQVAISEWERGVVMPSKMQDLADALDVDAGELAVKLAVKTVFGDDEIEQAILMEQRRLTPEARQALLTVYRYMRKNDDDLPAATMST